MVDWTATKEEVGLMTKIAKRAVVMAKEFGFEYRMIQAHMDVNACHSNGNPLDLKALASADDFNFAHDVFGIRRHLNRETGKLENCFLPRYSV